MTNTQNAVAVMALLLLSSCQSAAPPPAPVAELQEQAEVVETPVETIDYLTQGKQQGYEAAVAAQTAVDDRWKDVSAHWDLAIASLGQVPTDSPDYATAQAKIVEYTANRDVAAERYRAYQVKVAAPVPAPQAPRDTGKSSDQSLEEKMALIDGLPGRESTYARLLDQVDAKCTQNRAEIGDIAARSVEVAAQYGHRTNILDMLEGGHIATRNTDFQFDCVEIFSLIVTTMDAQ
ncbi:hypothetical protein H6F75_27160 [Nodosilinea sp. FACHB-131]|uniref:hypothetical protein n=1 Tax=Cyanophyceae TaxID=3028117 RepID=UPI0016881D14|nr:hypothetical protein [Nodosilinea sp. FACHB-131]MBD1877167.1 hypothetical protein [Nodosilinea sp. FACHB-131]